MNVEKLARLELKYPLHPSQLDTIRGVLSRYCVPDGFSLPEKKGWYSVDTLYFDSPDWRMFQSAENQDLSRFKLRVRTYPDAGAQVVKLEVKRRIKDEIVKTSNVAQAAGWAGWLEPGRDLSAMPEKPRRSLETFVNLQRATRAEPRVLIRYQRQAFRSLVDDYVRITFDREVVFQSMPVYSLAGHPRLWRPADDEGSIGRPNHLLMEVKFKLRPPTWIADMVRSMGLVRQGYSKYCSSVRLLQRDWSFCRDLTPSRGHWAA